MFPYGPFRGVHPSAIQIIGDLIGQKELLRPAVQNAIIDHEETSAPLTCFDSIPSQPTRVSGLRPAPWN